MNVKSQIWARRCFLGTLLFLLIHAAILFVLLPGKAIAHFDAAGQPDGVMPKGVFVTCYILLAGFLSLVFLPAVKASPRRSGGDFMPTFFLWLGTGLFLFLIDMFHQAFRVNAGIVETFEHPWIHIGVFVACEIVLAAVLVVKSK